MKNKFTILCEHFISLENYCRDCKEKENSPMSNEMEKVWSKINSLEAVDELLRDRLNAHTGALMGLEAFHNEWKDMTKWDMNPLYDRVGSLESELDSHDYRIDKIESWVGKQYPIIGKDEVTNKIEELNKKINSLGHSQAEILSRHVERIEKLEYIVSKDTNSNPISKDIKPYICPVCNGSGDFQIISAQDIRALGSHRIDGLGRHFTNCHACGGKGVLWG